MKENNKLPFHEALDKCLDGRTGRWLAEKTKIHESEISRLLSGRLSPTDSQVEKIKEVFPYLVYNN